MTTHEHDCQGFRDEQQRAEGTCMDWCYGCERCEPVRDGDYTVCGECLHVYRTAEELWERYVDGAPEGTYSARSVDDVFFCPVCMHDF